MIRARAECIGSRAEIGASYATIGLRAATDFSTAIRRPEKGQGAVSAELGRLQGVGEAGGDRVRRLEQRGAVAFTCMAVAVVVILLITIWGWL